MQFIDKLRKIKHFPHEHHIYNSPVIAHVDFHYLLSSPVISNHQSYMAFDNVDNKFGNDKMGNCSLNIPTWWNIKWPDKNNKLNHTVTTNRCITPYASYKTKICIIKGFLSTATTIIYSKNKWLNYCASMHTTGAKVLCIVSILLLTAWCIQNVRLLAH